MDSMSINSLLYSPAVGVSWDVFSIGISFEISRRFFFMYKTSFGVH